MHFWTNTIVDFFIAQRCAGSRAGADRIPDHASLEESASRAGPLASGADQVGNASARRNSSVSACWELAESRVRFVSELLRR